MCLPVFHGLIIALDLIHIAGFIVTTIELRQFAVAASHFAEEFEIRHGDAIFQPHRMKATNDLAPGGQRHGCDLTPPSRRQGVGHGYV